MNLKEGDEAWVKATVCNAEDDGYALVDVGDRFTLVGVWVDKKDIAILTQCHCDKHDGTYKMAKE